MFLCSASQVTLKTPSGDKTIECPADTYILDAAEVRALHNQYASSEQPFLYLDVFP